MTSWLASLPHQIPFRAAAGASVVDERTVEGKFLATANDALLEHETLPLLLVESMAQVGGILAFTGDTTHAWLSAIDEARIERLPEAGDEVLLRVTLDADFGGIYRFSGVALSDGLEIGRARFYLAMRGEREE